MSDSSCLLSLSDGEKKRRRESCMPQHRLGGYTDYFLHGKKSKRDFPEAHGKHLKKACETKQRT